MTARKSQVVHILLVEDNPGDVDLTLKALRDGKVKNEVSVASDGEEAMAFPRREGRHADACRPDLILLDLNLPKMDGREVLGAIKADATLRDIPVVILTSSAAERDIVESYRLQANCYVTKPVDLEQFLTVITTLEQFWLEVVQFPEMIPTSTPTRVLLVEDNPGDAELFRRTLSKATIDRFEVETVALLAQAVRSVRARPVDVIVLDLSLPDAFGIQTLDTMRTAAPATPIVVLTGDAQERLALEALSRGAQDYLVKGEVAGHVVARALLFAIERRHLEEQLVRRDDLLAEAERIASIGSFDWDITTDQVRWSDELRRIAGVDTAAAPRAYADLVAHVRAEDRGRVDELLRAAVTTRQPFDFEYRVVRGATTLLIRARGHVVADAAGRAAHMLGTCQDITARTLLEGKLTLAGRMSSVGTLASGIAHEINNPLSYVISNLDFVDQELRAIEGSPAPVAAARVGELIALVAVAREGAGRVREIVKGLKTFARADVEERRVSIDLPSVLELALTLTRNEIEHRARLVKDYGPTPRVEADEAMLCQVFVNVLINAAQAIGLGRVDENEIWITTLTDVAGRAVVEIHDTGCGIPEASRTQIFDPFFTTKPVGTATGLGLSISHAIVTAHGGEIALAMLPGSRGATLRVVLPAAPPPVAPQRLAAPAVVSTATQRRGSILVVDDEPLVVKTLRRILALEHDVVSAENGKEAMARFDAGERFDVILCDLTMPEMSGMELYDALSTTVPEQAQRMIFVSGGGTTPAARSFLERTPNRRLEKPFELLDVKTLVRSLVDS